jgi:sec-independent protein translocase protein TatC
LARLRAVKFDDRLTLVEHLDELRTRIIISLIAFGVAFALCFWQDSLMLEIANVPLPDDQDQPITFGVTEPFFTTVIVSAYGALVLSLPVILYQAYAFILPALSPYEKRTLLPFLVSIPLLFIAGVAFAYFIVLPAAVKFLLNFNASEFDIEVRARDYYTFFGLTTVALGLLFQIPIGVLSVTRLGIVTPEQFAANRRYAILIIAIVAAALPGGDPVSMILIMIPLILLYEGSVQLARRFGEPRDSDLGTTEPATERGG